jgi:hypothetical protein
VHAISFKPGEKPVLMGQCTGQRSSQPNKGIGLMGRKNFSLEMNRNDS